MTADGMISGAEGVPPDEPKQELGSSAGSSRHDGEPVRRGFGRVVYGLGIVALALVAFAWRDFDPGQQVPKDLPDRAVLAAAAATVMLVAGAAVAWHRTASWGASALTAYYGLIVIVLTSGRIVLRHPGEFGAYSSTAEQLAIVAAALIVFATYADISRGSAARLIDMGRRTFGLCAVLFGTAHFVYPNLTAPLVPPWLPPSQAFWAYATGVGQITAGVALLTNVRGRLATILLTGLYVSFSALVHSPMLLANQASRTNWSESALNLALIGVAWVVADSFTLTDEQGALR